MKILKESKRLVEEETMLDVEKTSEDKLADAIQDDAAAEGKELTDKEADKAAENLKDLAKTLEDTNFATTNELVAALNKCLKRALDPYTPGWKNLLINGLPGSGKTAIVQQWGERNNVKIHYLDSKSRDLPTAMSGMPARDDEQRDKVSMLKTTYLDPLDDTRRINKRTGDFEEKEPYVGVVLFLDELNRAKTDIRGSLLTLINDHKIANGKNGGARYFDKFLFTIAAVNPTEAGDVGINKLIGAELSRFGKQIKYDSTPQAARNYFSEYFKENIKILLRHQDDPVFPELYTKAVRQRDLVDFLLGSVQPPFKFDDRDDYPKVLRNEYNLFCQRSLTDALLGCDGTVASFIEECEDENFAPDKMELIKRILSGYDDPEVKLPNGVDPVKEVEDEVEDNPEHFDGINTDMGKTAIFQQSEDDIKNVVKNFTDNLNDL